MGTRPILVVLAAVALSLIGGCAGDSARVRAVGPAMAAAWPSVKADAELGARARGNSPAAAAMGVELEAPGVAELRLERVRQFDDAVGVLTAPR
jgi:hypothetical protein